MASAVLASQNETSWVHMGKISYSNPHLNDNPNPKKRHKQFHHAPVDGIVVRHHQNADSPAVTQTFSDDAYSFNQTSTSYNHGNYGGYLIFRASSYTKSEAIELRKRLLAELEQIRDLRCRIESGQFSYTRNPKSCPKFRNHPGNKCAVSAVGSLSNRVSNGFENGNSGPVNFDPLLKECKQIVAKLIKHKYGYVFKTPVNAGALGLHDYHLIVKRLMDLGTVKANLAKNFYATPAEFAADVRLTFDNAILYNPKHDPVHVMAKQMLTCFEDLFKLVQEKVDRCVSQWREKEFLNIGDDDLQFHGNDEVQGSSWKLQGSPVPVRQIGRKPERTHSSASTPLNPPPLPLIRQPIQEQISSPGRAPPLPFKEQKAGRAGGTVKQLKLRAKDPNKRSMSMEEKQKLGFGLQSLPQEKMPQLVHIIRKRNKYLAQDGDEIELDIEALDTETLWELDRFVTNWKKLVSKTKKQALVTNNDAVDGVTAPSTPTAVADLGMLSDKNDELVQKLKDNDDEDVDIDDDMPATSFPPVEIERDEGVTSGGGSGQNHDRNIDDDRGNSCSSSSSSSSESSSSSDSDSGSSSGGDSDADDAQS